MDQSLLQASLKRTPSSDRLCTEGRLWLSQACFLASLDHCHRQICSLSDNLEKNLQLLPRASTSSGSIWKTILSQISSGTEKILGWWGCGVSWTSSSIVTGSLYNMSLLSRRENIKQETFLCSGLLFLVQVQTLCCPVFGLESTESAPVYKVQSRETGQTHLSFNPINNNNRRG